MNSRLHLAWITWPLLLAACDDASDANRVVGELASDRIELTAEAAEPITEILVAEGETVTRGQVLLRQDAARAEARLAEAQAAVGQAQARLDELVRGPRSEQIAAARANVEGTKDELEFRRSEYERMQRIHAQKLASPDQLDQAEAALDAANANDKLRRAQLQELLSGTTVEELAQAENAVKQSAARRDQIRVDVSRHDITAPVDGIVDSRLFEPGERPNPGQVVMIMLPGEQVYARVYVPEHLRVKVAPGLAAKIYVDGLDQVLDGRVRWVASEAAFTPYYALTERDRGHLTYLAKVDISEQRDRLPDGVPVDVVFIFGGSE
ncbi:MAG: HlyD family efflux transporter periplasmic adaptor subunit [Gammaproteobacteria bacterium]|nr:HlyD family efflux transporter periplasmic adaptor subunit [Gammaproteobacteria bacterium]MDH3373082.1 HlyD family efflux transporter periplasmic adaptor subunit [Gammaproteobacteria bacterium]MDH3408314.1 HlyD family efflux transporter periplasmic adaptor subunit [Gammaproteobacteria bacterium]MDH3553029.1 HlyD family efflux transporter periplasmic adaptor subunit [Gammaproteobacteria bacterium]